MKRPQRRDGGETLIETLITIMILGLVATALMTGLYVANQTSAMDSRIVSVQTIIRAASDQATSLIANDARYFQNPNQTSPCRVTVTLSAPSGFSVTAQIFSATAVPQDAAPPANTAPQTPTFNTSPDSTSTCTDKPLKKVKITIQDKYGHPAYGLADSTTVIFVRRAVFS